MTAIFRSVYPSLVTTVCLHFASVICMRSIISFGPQNITRMEGETSVYIPCPFPGSSSPIWKIDSLYFEASTLPGNLIPASYGLFITQITASMNGTTFQCLVYNGTGYEFSSTGVLIVELIESKFTELIIAVIFYNLHFSVCNGVEQDTTSDVRTSLLL